VVDSATGSSAYRMKAVVHVHSVVSKRAPPIQLGRPLAHSPSPPPPAASGFGLGRWPVSTQWCVVCGVGVGRGPGLSGLGLGQRGVRCELLAVTQTQCEV
jgi:hypothetical protein